MKPDPLLTQQWEYQEASPSLCFSPAGALLMVKVLPSCSAGTFVSDAWLLLPGSAAQARFICSHRWKIPLSRRSDLLSELQTSPAPFHRVVFGKWSKVKAILGVGELVFYFCWLFRGVFGHPWFWVLLLVSAGEAVLLCMNAGVWRIVVVCVH